MPQFYFGASLSAHQCEGNNIHSDWWEFEQTKLIQKGIYSGKASNHWDLFEEDFQIASELGHNAHRFSIEWAKIEPKEGYINYSAIAHYKKVFETLSKYKLTPFTTLFHFTLPKWFADKGGFEKKDNIRHFTNFCKFIGTTFREEMRYIITINEPNVYAYHSYLVEKWPPQKKSYWTYRKVMNNLAEAHREAYLALKNIKPEFSIGISTNNQVFKPDRENNLLDNLLVKFLHHQWNFWFMDRVKDHSDYIGLNYYFYRCVKADPHLVDSFYQMSYPTSRKTDMNWEVYPKGLYITINELTTRYKLPIIITESGVADSQDKLREDTIRESLYWIFKSRSEGADVFGYLHWALTDNFEWDSGYDPRFGLAKVDYDNNYLRTIRPSALVYRDLIAKYTQQLDQK
jgi:beta-glucosidase